MNTFANTWFTILNPNAGSGKTMSVWMKAEKRLSDGGVRTRVKTTDGPGHAAHLAFEAAGKGYRRFLAVGGDGTVHETLQGIMRYVSSTEDQGDRRVKVSDFALAVIPIGSGNDWLRSLDIPNDLDEVIKRLEAEQFTTQDVVKVTSQGLESEERRVSYMANVGGVGFDARICDIVNSEKEAGVTRKMIYFSAVKRSVFSYKGMTVEILADGKSIYSGPCFTISVGNGRFSGGGLRQTPKAEINDGAVDVLFVEKATLKLVITALPKVLGNNLTDCKDLHFLRCKSLEVRPIGDSEIVEVDGEVVGRTGVLFEVLEEKLNVLPSVLGRRKKKKIKVS
ncbi:MAG: YegS/Rv2252/BmrU family lipid kinase [Bacteroidales bacterium]|nr:YegS/Rv2252/BmrU family lipid kinase [Bacteroidales bacterium]